MVFVSFVGTSAMSVWNALLVLDPRPDKVLLFSTEKSHDVAKKLKAEMVKRGFHVDEIRKLSTVEEGSGLDLTRKVFRQAIADAGNAEIAFNVAGGLNFQVAACMGSVDREQLRNMTILYPERVGVHSLRLNGNEISDHRILPLPEPIKFFNLQGLRYSMEKDEAQRPAHCILARELRKCNVELPVGFTVIRLNGVLFHAFWNCGNELALIKVMDSDHMKAARVNHLSEVSALIEFATDREASADLYHKKIALFTNHPTVVEHARTAMGKITVFKYGGDDKDREIRKSRLKAFIKPEQSPLPAAPDAAPETIVFDHAGGFVKGRSLVVMLGPNTPPTFTALYSHAPEHAIVLYTSGNGEVERCVNAMRQNGARMPVGRITFQPVDFPGLDILKLLSIEGQIHCNTQPGTKTQGVFLALWAAAHGAECYSIHNQTQCLPPLGTGPEIPLAAPTPLDVLELSGVPLRTRGCEMAGNTRKHVIRAILDFMQTAVDQKFSLAHFPEKKTALTTGGKLNVLEHKRRRIQRGGKAYEWLVKEGHWVQEVVALALEDCGVQDVRYGVQLAHDKENERYFMEKYNLAEHERPYLSDLDVIARRGGDYLLIECKSDDVLAPDYPPKPDLPTLKKIKTRVNAQKSLMGRLAVPLIFSLRYAGDPVTFEEVYVFGHKTLVDKEALADLLKTSVAERRKPL